MPFRWSRGCAASSVSGSATPSRRGEAAPGLADSRPRRHVQAGHRRHARVALVRARAPSGFGREDRLPRPFRAGVQVAAKRLRSRPLTYTVISDQGMGGPAHGTRGDGL
jgi:hypothetical protein